MHKSIYNHVILVSTTGKKKNQQRRDQFQVGSIIVSNYPLLWISVTVTGYFLMYEVPSLQRSLVPSKIQCLKIFKFESTSLSVLKSLLTMMIHSSAVKTAQSSRASIQQGRLQTSHGGIPMQKLYIYKNQDFENNLWLSTKGK